MNTRPTLRHLLLAAAIIGLGAARVCPAADEITDPDYHWDMSAATEENGVVTIPEKITSGEFVAPAVLGLHVEKDDAAPGGKAVTFSGVQEAAPQGKQIAVTGSIAISLKAKPIPGAAQQTLIYVWAVAELRYQQKPSGPAKLSLIVWPSDKSISPVEISGKINAEEWNTINASVKDGKMTLTINGETTTGELPAGSEISAKSTPVWFGHGNQRPYSGSLADVRLAVGR